MRMKVSIFRTHRERFFFFFKVWYQHDKQVKDVVINIDVWLVWVNEANYFTFKNIHYLIEI